MNSLASQLSSFTAVETLTILTAGVIPQMRFTELLKSIWKYTKPHQGLQEGKSRFIFILFLICIIRVCGLLSIICNKWCCWIYLREATVRCSMSTLPCQTAKRNGLNNGLFYQGHLCWVWHMIFEQRYYSYGGNQYGILWHILYYDYQLLQTFFI